MNETCPPEYSEPKEKPVWLGALLVCLVGGVAGFAMALSIYISTQQPKLWLDRQWAGLALYKGGYRSWSLSFCDGFTIAPGTYTNALARMVPVTIDEKQGTTRYGYHWPKYAHNDIRLLLKKHQANLKASSPYEKTIQMSVPRTDDFNLTLNGNATLSFTNSPEPPNGVIMKDVDTGNLWKYEGGKWTEFVPKPKDRPPRPPHVTPNGDLENPADNP